MATHSSVLAWRIPGVGEPGGLLSMGSHRVRHDWSNLSAAAAAAVPVRHCGGALLALHFTAPLPCEVSEDDGKGMQSSTGYDIMCQKPQWGSLWLGLEAWKETLPPLKPRPFDHSSVTSGDRKQSRWESWGKKKWESAGRPDFLVHFSTCRVERKPSMTGNSDHTATSSFVNTI